MTTDLKSMTVEELAKYFGGIFDQACNSIVAFDELARRLEEAQQTLSRFSDAMERDSEEIESLHRRLEEAQQKIVAQQERIRKLRQVDFCPDCDNTGAYYVRTVSGEGEPVQCRWCYDNPRSLFNLLGVEDDFSALAAHDAKVAAEALEEFENSFSRWDDDVSIDEVIRRLRVKAAEYRAKAAEAGRKE